VDFVPPGFEPFTLLRGQDAFNGIPYAVHAAVEMASDMKPGRIYHGLLLEQRSPDQNPKDNADDQDGEDSRDSSPGGLHRSSNPINVAPEGGSAARTKAAPAGKRVVRSAKNRRAV
jgi:hypothetical protein